MYNYPPSSESDDSASVPLVFAEPSLFIFFSFATKGSSALLGGCSFWPIRASASLDWMFLWDSFSASLASLRALCCCSFRLASNCFCKSFSCFCFCFWKNRKCEWDWSIVVVFAVFCLRKRVKTQFSDFQLVQMKHNDTVLNNQLDQDFAVKPLNACFITSTKQVFTWSIFCCDSRLTMCWVEPLRPPRPDPLPRLGFLPPLPPLGAGFSTPARFVLRGRPPRPRLPVPSAFLQ